MVALFLRTLLQCCEQSLIEIEKKKELLIPLKLVNTIRAVTEQIRELKEKENG